jgi:glycogen synthase
MRVLLLGPYPPPHGGVQTHVVALRDFIRRRGHFSVVINLTRHRQLHSDEVWYPRHALELLSLLRRLPWDLAHIHVGGLVTARLLWLCLLCAWWPGKRALLTLHSGGYPSSPAGRLTHPRTFRAFVMRQLDGVIAVNPDIAAWFVTCGVAGKRVHLISPHAIPSVSAGELRADLNLFYGLHQPVLVSVGLLEPEYDLPLQIDALEGVLERHPRAGLVLIGSGPLEDELRARIEAVPYSAHMLLAGDVPHEITLRAIALADAYVRTTLYDGDSISVREALHLGVPVVATDNGMRPPGCHLIPPGNVEALRSTIMEVLEHRSRRCDRAAASADDVNLGEVVSVYADVMA